MENYTVSLRSLINDKANPHQFCTSPKLDADKFSADFLPILISKIGLFQDYEVSHDRISENDLLPDQNYYSLVHHYTSILHVLPTVSVL